LTNLSINATGTVATEGEDVEDVEDEREEEGATRGPSSWCRGRE